MARVVDGRFTLLDRLGGGGMGLVWRARDETLHREVAVKEVRPPDPDLAEHSPEAARALRERVLREARALARVGQPNVVTMYQIVDGGENAYPWLVMELVRGGSLQDRLARGPLLPAEAAALGRGVLAGLRAAHAADVQHRDIKPGNILLRPDGTPVLTDFGIAAIQGATTLTVSGSVIGTPEYMAPERVSGEEGGPAADLWSLAVTLYAAVEGHNPLRRGNTLATLAAVLSEDVPPPRQAGPLTKVLTAVLVRDPEARPDADTLDRLLAEAAAEPAEAAPAAVAEPGPTPEHRARAEESMPGEPVAGPAAAITYATPPPPSATSSPPAPRQRAGRTPERDTPQPPAPSGRGRARLRRYGVAVGAVALTGALLWTLLTYGYGESGEKITVGVNETADIYSAFEKDTATYLAESLGHRPEDIEWREVNSTEVEELIENGEVDFHLGFYEMPDYDDFPDPLEVGNAGPYLVAQQDVLVRRDDTSIGNAEDLKGKSVCAVTGSDSAYQLKMKIAPLARLKEMSSDAKCVSALKSGSVDAVTTDKVVLERYAAKEPDALKAGGLELPDVPYGIGVQPDNPLGKDLTKALKRMISDGTWARALKKNIPGMPVKPPTVR